MLIADKYHSLDEFSQTPHGRKVFVAEFEIFEFCDPGLLYGVIECQTVRQRLAFSIEEQTMNRRRIWVAGHKGMVGSAITRYLEGRGDEVLKVDRSVVDLRNQISVEVWLKQNRPDDRLRRRQGRRHLRQRHLPRRFHLRQLAIETNSSIPPTSPASTAWCFWVRPHLSEIRAAADQGEVAADRSVETTNEWYAIAKIAGIKLCQAYRKQYGRHYISVMPCNLYGPNDNFDLTTSHVLPALIRKFHEAKVEGREEVVVWGTGTPLREFLHVDDLARGVVFCLDNYDEYEHINCGAGSETTIRGLAEIRRTRHGLFRPDRVRYDEARRHAAQADGFKQDPRIGMEAGDCSR